MIILENEQAIEYLQRARSCIDQERSFYSGLPILSAMLDIERAYLERNIILNEPGRPKCLAVDATGFPELASWKADCNQVFMDIDILRNKRARAIAPLLQAFTNASVSGVKGELDRIKTALTPMDFYMAGPEFLPGEIKTRVKNNKCFYLDKKHPGLLLCDREIAYFHREVRIVFLQNPGTDAFKFLDECGTGPALPVLIMQCIVEDANGKRKGGGGNHYNGKIRLLTEGAPLLDRSLTVDGWECSIRGCTMTHTYRNAFKTTGIQICKSDEVEGYVNRLSGPSKEMLLSADLTCLTPLGRARFLQSLGKLDLLSQKIDLFISGTVKDGKTSWGDFIAEGLDLADMLASVFDGADDDECLSLQLVLGALLNPIRGKIEEIIKSPASASLLVSGDKEVALTVGQKKWGVPGWLRLTSGIK